MATEAATMTIPDAPVCDWCDKPMTFDKFISDFRIDKDEPAADVFMFECKRCDTWYEVPAN